MANFLDNAIFWIEVDKIKPNPYQPRKEFDKAQLQSLADSIRQYGVLQALVVTRKEEEKPDGGLSVYYELIAGERRLRASKLAGLSQVPALIRTGDESNQMKLELAIIENIQREDLNPIDRAKAFQKLVKEFGFKHGQVGEKVGKSREYVTNSIRLLTMPEEMQQGLAEGKITEGHTRPIMMLNDRPEEQAVLFKEIIYKKLTVREAERIARSIAKERVKKKEYPADPELDDMEEQFTLSLGTRVHIERRENGGKLEIDFFSNDDLKMILDMVKKSKGQNMPTMIERYEATLTKEQVVKAPQRSAEEGKRAEVLETPSEQSAETKSGAVAPEVVENRIPQNGNSTLPDIDQGLGKEIEEEVFDDREDILEEEKKTRDEVLENVPDESDTTGASETDKGDDLYTLKNFSI